MTQAAVEMLHTLFNEITNSDWTFDDQPMEGVHIDEPKNEIHVILPRNRMLKVIVKEGLVPDYRKCPKCHHVKPGWPDHWANVGGKGLMYACEDCVAEYAAGLKVPVVLLDRPPEAKHG